MFIFVFADLLLKLLFNCKINILLGGIVLKNKNCLYSWLFVILLYWIIFKVNLIEVFIYLIIIFFNFFYKRNLSKFLNILINCFIYFFGCIIFFNSFDVIYFFVEFVFNFTFNILFVHLYDSIIIKFIGD